MSPAESQRLRDAQAAADQVYRAHGVQAPPPVHAEDALSYRRRLAHGLQHHSADLKTANLATLAAGPTFDLIARTIYADAEANARNPANVPRGTLREIVTPARSRRQITEFVGHIDDAFSHCKAPAQRVKFIFPAVKEPFMARINAANLSLQHHDFHFREPETNRPLVQTIYAGRQIQIYKEESPEILAAIVAQHEKYGIVAAKSLKRATESVGLCYQFDKPIVIATILEGMLENKRRLEESGPKMIKTAAIAAGCSVREHLYSEGLKQVENYSIEIEETSPTELRGADAESFEKSRFHRLFGVDLEN